MTLTAPFDAVSIYDGGSHVALRNRLELLDPANRELVASGLRRLQQIREGRHAKNTREGHAYWQGRYRDWLADPSQRRRAEWQLLGPALGPMLPVDETMALIWLDDVVTDAIDDEGNIDHGVAPGTISTLVQALKAATRNADEEWLESVMFADTLQGLRLLAAEDHEVNKARPLMLADLREMCTMLHDHVAAETLRDQLIIHLRRLGYEYCAIANLRIGVEDDATESHSPSISRSGPELDAAAQCALDLWLALRGTESGFLIPLTPKNRRAHVRKIVLAVARETGLSVGSRITGSQASAMIDVVWATANGRAKAVRDRALLLTGWSTALRRSEICELELRDVTVLKAGIHLRIRRSKTDQMGLGAVLPISPGKGRATCPVQALLEWINVIDPDGDADPRTPLFQSIDRHGNLRIGAPTRAAAKANGTRVASGRLRGEDIEDIIRTRAVQAALCTETEASEFSGHSLRRGFITEAAIQGHDALLISKTTRHKSLKIISEYVDEAQALTINVGSRLGL